MPFTGIAGCHRYTPTVPTANGVSLVIPAHNAGATITDCLGAVEPLLGHCGLSEIVVVDDASTDTTRSIIEEFDVTCLTGPGKGAGAARNIGWRSASSPLIWFVDADCVAEPDALAVLLGHLEDAAVAGVGGSYGIMTADSLLARLIHEEIVERHLSIPSRVDFLATFNVVYRRCVLEEVGGFDERFLKGQDAELAWRIIEAGHDLAFDVRSRVKHYHPVALRPYFRTQCQQGFWRVGLHLRHKGRAIGNSYSNWLDHVAPPLALLATASLPLTFVVAFRLVPAALFGLLLVTQLPMSWRLLRRKREASYLAFAAMGFLRSFSRGVGLLGGALAAVLRPASNTAVTRTRPSNHNG